MRKANQVTRSETERRQIPSFHARKQPPFKRSVVGSNPTRLTSPKRRRRRPFPVATLA